MPRMNNKSIILADLGAIQLAIEEDWESYDYIIQKAIFDAIEDVNALIYAKRWENKLQNFKLKEV